MAANRPVHEEEYTYFFNKNTYQSQQIEIWTDNEFLASPKTSRREIGSSEIASRHVSNLKNKIYEHQFSTSIFNHQVTSTFTMPPELVLIKLFVLPDRRGY